MNKTNEKSVGKIVLKGAVAVLVAATIGAAAFAFQTYKANENNCPKTKQENPPVDYKPALYLYPDKEQKIEVKLDKSIKYLNVIPNYHNGWVVMAKPTGILYDLQPQYTNCDELPFNEFGFEYSKKACEVNAYPYIFWDGVQLMKPLPDKDLGFIVSKDEIDNFLNDKADIMKFNSDEKAEFVSYWSYRMKGTDWDNFRVYFLQNEEVDKYLPIKVSPKPTSSNRIQIIISKAEGNEEIAEQPLIPIARTGFTLVEWGGVLK